MAATPATTDTCPAFVRAPSVPTWMVARECQFRHLHLYHIWRARGARPARSGARQSMATWAEPGAGNTLCGALIVPLVIDEREGWP